MKNCNFLVDTYFPGSEPSANEPAFMLDTKNWEIVTCEPFLDAARTPTIPRLLWLPIEFDGMRRQYGQHCLFRRKSDREIDEEAAAHLQEVKEEALGNAMIEEAVKEPEVEALPVEEGAKVMPIKDVDQPHEEL